MDRSRTNPSADKREDIPRYATRCCDGPADVRPAHDLPRAISDRLQGKPDARSGHIVVVLLGIPRRTPQGITVIGPRIGDVTLDAEHGPVGGVAQVVKSRAAFDVATAKRHLRIRRIDIPAAPVRQLQGSQIRVIAVDEKGAIRYPRRCGPGSNAGERTARCNLGDRTIVHEHELRVDPRVIVDVVMDKCAGGVALVRPLEVVQRGEVVKRRGPGRQLTGGRVEVLSALSGVVESGHEGGG